MAYQRETGRRSYSSPSRVSPTPVVTGPGIFGIGSYRPGTQRQAVINAPSSSPGTFGGLEDIFGSVAKAAQGYGQQIGKGLSAAGITGSQDPLDQILSQLQGGMGGGGSAISDADLMAQARAEAAAQFNPQLSAIDTAIAQAKERTRYNQSGIGQLYDQLAASYASDIMSSGQTFKEAKGEERKISKTGRKEIAAAYSTAEKDLAAQMTQLGIQAAAPDVLPNLSSDEAAMLASEAAKSATEQRAYTRQGTAEKAYYQEGPSLARIGKAEGQSALTEQLNQYLLQQQGERSMLGAQKQLTYNALLGKYRQGAAEQQQQSQQQNFSNLRGLLSSVLSVKKFQADQNKQPAGPKPTYSGMLGAAQVFSENPRYNQERASQFQGYLQDFIRTNLSQNNQGQRINDYPTALNALQAWGQSRGMSSTDLDWFAKALAAYMNVYK